MTAITLHETDQHAHLRSDTAECSGSPDGIFAPTVQLHVEVRLHAQSLLHRDAVTAEITSALINNVSTFRANCTLDLADWWLPAVLRSDVTRVYVRLINPSTSRTDSSDRRDEPASGRQPRVGAHLGRQNQELRRSRLPNSCTVRGDAQDARERVGSRSVLQRGHHHVATVRRPRYARRRPTDRVTDAAIEDLWENLHFTTQLKESLQHFVDSAMLFSRRGINEHMVTCNRMIFLHGPPGSGKSSLCRGISCHALARRLLTLKHSLRRSRCGRPSSRSPSSNSTHATCFPDGSQSRQRWSPGSSKMCDRPYLIGSH